MKLYQYKGENIMLDKSCSFLEDIKLTYEETYDSMQYTSHFHNSFEIIGILEGETEFVVNKKIYTAGAGSLVFISHLEAHQVRTVCCPYKRYIIEINPDSFYSAISDFRLSSILKHRPDGFNHVLSLAPEEIAPIFSLLAEMKWEYGSGEEYCHQSLNAMLQLFFIRMFRMHSENFPLASVQGPKLTILQVQKYIDEHYLEALTLKDIASRFYMDMYYLSHLFKQVCGFTVKEYIILMRISKAKDLLVHTCESITDISSLSGFGNLNHFIRVFKNTTGLSPLKYRKRVNKKITLNP